MHADKVEQSYHFWIYTDRARLLLLDLYHHLAIENVVVWAFCSEICKIAGEALP